MLSHKYRCIFIEVPKTGSTSIRSLIGFPSIPHQAISHYHDWITQNWMYMHRGYRLANGIYRAFVPGAWRRNIGERQFNSYYKFGFVRNPWARVVSLYLRREGIELRDEMTFEDFVHWIRWSSDTSVYITGMRNQLDWFTNDEGKLLVDFIGKFENLDADWKKVAKQIGADPILPHKNEGSTKQHYTSFYTDETRAIVAEKFKVDIDYFGYTFEA